jgi:hypothetical protein
MQQGWRRAKQTKTWRRYFWDLRELFEAESKLLSFAIGIEEKKQRQKILEAG